MDNLLQSFVFGASSHSVRIIEEDGRPLFRASDVGDVLELSNIHKSIVSFDDDEKVLTRSYTHGGTQDVTFLTETGVYRLVMRSNKPIARPFQKWVCMVIKSIREDGRYVVVEEIEKYKAEAEARLREEVALGEKRAREEVEEEFEERLKKIKAETVDSADCLKAKCMEDAAIACHENMVTVFDRREVVYIAKIVDRDENVIIKIGSTKNIRDRVSQLRHKFRGHFRLLHCFECREAFKFERLLQGHRDIKKFRFTEDVIAGERSSEVFAVSPKDLERIVNIARYYNRTQFALQTPTEQRLAKIEDKLEKLLEVTGAEVDEEEVATAAAAPDDDGFGDDTDLEDPEIAAARADGTLSAYFKGFPIVQKRGRHIQKYSADGKELLQTYERLRDVIGDTALEPRASRCGLDLAVKTRTLYRGFRWHFIAKGTTRSRVFDIGETDTSKKEFNFGAVARLDQSGTRIDKMYASRTDIATELGMASSGGRMYTSIKNGEPVKGRMYVPVSKLSTEQIDAFVADGGVIPDPTKNRTSNKKIDMIDVKTGEIVNTFETLQEVTTRYSISYSTLYKAIDGGLEERGHKWAFAA
jgi:prophage antirepressor-like protein